MTSFSGAIDRDANRQVIDSNEAIKVTNDWTFVTATTGAVGAHNLFTITGDVIVNMFATVSDTLTSAGDTATLEVGFASDTAYLINQFNQNGTVDGFAITNGEARNRASAMTNSGGVETTLVASGSSGTRTVILTIATEAVTGGTMKFYALYRPLTEGAKIEAITPA